MTRPSLYPPADLPTANPTTSYWLSQPHPYLEGYSSGDKPPTDVDAVIIGSGISGALIAHGILAREPQARLLMLEARNVCNGASGRNGGHIKPDCYKSFARFQETYGTEVAKALCRFEVENMKDCVQFIRDKGLAEAIDLVETRSVDIFMSNKSWQEAKVSLARYEKAGGDLGDIKVHEKNEVDQKFRVQDAFGAVSYPACSLWPRKLVLGLIESAISRGLLLFTHTPVIGIAAASGARQWAVNSKRGTVTCDRVYHATNGYISHLLPQFAGKVVPVKGNVAAIQPSPAFDRTPLDHTCGIQWADDFDYMIQRPADGKPIIYGGRDLLHPRSLTGVIGDTDDSITTPEIQEGLKNFPTKYFKGWGADSKVRYAWSGIMGFTADELPFVGEMPGLPGQFVAAGYTGHGMARVFLTIKALMQIVYNEAVDSRVPAPYFNIQQRLQHRNTAWEEMLKKAYGFDSLKNISPKL